MKLHVVGYILMCVFNDRKSQTCVIKGTAIFIKDLQKKKSHKGDHCNFFYFKELDFKLNIIDDAWHVSGQAQKNI